MSQKQVHIFLFCHWTKRKLTLYPQTNEKVIKGLVIGCWDHPNAEVIWDQDRKNAGETQRKYSQNEN